MPNHTSSPFSADDTTNPPGQASLFEETDHYFQLDDTVEEGSTTAEKDERHHSTSSASATASPTPDALASAATAPTASNRRSTVVTIAALVVGIIALWFLVSELTTASSMQGTTVGNLIHLRATAPGAVSEVIVDEADQVESGQLVVKLDASGSDDQLARTGELLDLKRLEADQVELAIAEEKQRLQLLHEISQRTEKMLELSIEENEIQLELASELADELDGSVKRGSAKKFEYLEAENNRLRMAKRLEEKRGELDLQKLITANAAEYRHYHNGVVRNWLDELQLHAAKVATEIGQTQVEAATLRSLVNQGTVTTHRAGRVFAVHHQPGSTVQAGDPLITLETDDRVWIIASFKYSEAEDIAYGDRATIDFPALDRSITGSVSAIGHNVISAVDADSPFLRMTPEEVLVKIEPDSPIDELRSGIAARVTIRTGGFQPLSWFHRIASHFQTPETEMKTRMGKPKPSAPIESTTPAEVKTPAPMNSPFDFSHR